jgi:hypothetical protein
VHARRFNWFSAAGTSRRSTLWLEKELDLLQINLLGVWMTIKSQMKMLRRL